MKYRFIALIILNCFFISHLKSEKQPLSLDEAITKALERNFDIQITQTEDQIARNNNRLGNAGFLPDLRLIFNQGNRFVDADNPASFLDGQYRNVTGDSRLEMNWDLFNGFRAHISKDRLNLLEEQSAGQVKLVVENTLQAVILSYFQVWIEKEKLNTLNELVELSRDRLELAELQREIGTIGRFEYLQIKNNFITDSTQFARQSIFHNRSVRDFKKLLRIDDATDLALTDTPVISENIFSKNEMLSLLMANNRDLKNQYIRLEIIQKNLALERTNRYPRLSMQAGSSYTLNDFKLEDNPSTLGRTFDYYVNFSLTFNLFNGGNITREIQNARIQENIAQLETGEIEQSVKFHFLNIYDNYEMLRELTNLNEFNKDNTEVLLELAKERFENGTISIFDYRFVQMDFLNAALAYLESLFELKAAEVELLRLTGGLVEEIQF